MATHIVIPVRLDSSRLPKKALADLGGKSMINRVYDLALKSGIDNVIIGTDSVDIRDHCQQFAEKVCMTSSGHESGTERVGEVVDILDLDDDDVVINLQGDEPLLPPAVLTKLAEALEYHRSAGVATLATPIWQARELLDPNVTKVVTNARGFAMYFSRAPIPYDLRRFPEMIQQSSDEKLDGKHLRHIGLYAYRVSFLRQHIASGITSEAAAFESLEQLSVLYNSGRIFVQVFADAIERGVDTPEDLERVQAFFTK